MKSKYLIFTQPNCIFCDKVKAFLTKHGDEYEEIEVKDVKDFKARGYTTVPQVFHYVGGYEDLKELFIEEGEEDGDQ